MKKTATTKDLMEHPMFRDHPQHAAYQARIAHLEDHGFTTSDAQGTADTEYRMGLHKLLWDYDYNKEAA